MSGRDILDREANYEDNGDGTVLERLSMTIDRAAWYAVEWPSHAITRQWGDVSGISGPYESPEAAETAN